MRTLCVTPPPKRPDYSYPICSGAVAVAAREIFGPIVSQLGTVLWCGVVPMYLEGEG
jgi:hypothetical protein